MLHIFLTFFYSSNIDFFLLYFLSESAGLNWLFFLGLFFRSNRDCESAMLVTYDFVCSYNWYLELCVWFFSLCSLCFVSLPLLVLHFFFSGRAARIDEQDWTLEGWWVFGRRKRAN